MCSRIIVIWMNLNGQIIYRIQKLYKKRKLTIIFRSGTKIFFSQLSVYFRKTFSFKISFCYNRLSLFVCRNFPALSYASSWKIYFIEFEF